jgi:fatty-acid desaturase
MSSKSGTDKKAAGINWFTTIWMIIFHLGAIAALFMFSWKALIASVALWWIAGSPGVGMGFHRLLTHRGYKTPKWVEYVLTVCGTLAFEGGPINWVVTHRLHHAHTEVPGLDPHTPRDGGWWAHMGWILSGSGARVFGPVALRAGHDEG